MSKYKTKVKIAQIQSLVEEKKYKKAAALLATLDVMQVRSRADLHTFAEVYMKTEQYEAAKATYLRLYKKNRSKRVLHRLIYLAIRTNEMDEAEEYYIEFLGLSTNQRENLILRYRIDKAKGAPVSRLIETLQDLKKVEYIEEWAYELAKLYQRAGRLKECEQECRDIQLWFGQGEIVERSKVLMTYLRTNGTMIEDDRDYTEEPKEEPNPLDTGSLPELDMDILKRKKEEQKGGTARERFLKFTGLWSEEDEEALREERRQEKLQEQQEHPDEESIRLQQHLMEAVRDIDGDSVEELEDAENVASDEPVEAEDAPDEVMAEAEKTGATGSEEWTEKSGQDRSDEPCTDEEPEDDRDERTSEDGEPDDPEDETDDLDEDPGEDEALSMDEEEDWDSLEQEQNEPHERKAPDHTGITQDLAETIAQIVAMEKNNLLQTEPVVANDTPVTAQPQIPQGMEEITGENPDEEDITMIDLDEIMPTPDMPEMKQVVPQDSPELGKKEVLQDKDLPTTRALHHSLDDMLTLIAGELEPKHFVLMGKGDEIRLGVTKKVVRIQHRKKFLSTTQIARIDAEKLNNMDLLAVASQIKGSCLLIDNAAQLSFPTITSLFTLMDEFKGDFMVVLADEGNTLDEMFRVAPALARRFEYVIDISQYSEEESLK